jgi:hypothetical protein
MGKSQDYIIRLQAENHRLKQKFAETQGTARKFTTSMATMGKQAAGSLGLFFGVGALAMGISSSIRKIADFEFQMDKVAAVSRASAEEVKALKDNALALGASTKFTATEIGKMQEEIARLGFTSSQIVDTTDSIRKLATVADTELGEAAKVMVKTLNAFNLSAKESERVANVMAESFSMSALDMEGFGTAMAYAGTAGKTFGLNIEQVTAMIGTLIDSGIQAQKAGSGLRDIFADLATKGITLKEAYDQVNKSANKSVTANELVGKTSMNQLIILAEQQEKTERLTEAFSDQTKEMNAQVDVMEDNLLTDWALFTSAIDGLVQKGGALNDFFRDAVQGMTDLVTAINEGNWEKLLGSQLIMPLPNVFVDWIKSFDELDEAMQMDAPQQLDTGLKFITDALKKTKEEVVQTTNAIKSLGELTSKGIGSLGGISAQPMVLKDGMKEIGGELNAEAQLQMDTFNGIMKSGVIDGLGAFADGLATGGLQGAFQGLFQVIGGGLQTLGKSLIAFGFSMEAFKKAFTNPIAAIAAGAAAIAAGAFVKNAASNLSSSVGGGGGASYSGGGGGSASISQQSITINGELKATVGMKELSFSLENFRARDGRTIGR